MKGKAIRPKKASAARLKGSWCYAHVDCLSMISIRASVFCSFYSFCNSKTRLYICIKLMSPRRQIFTLILVLGQHLKIYLYGKNVLYFLYDIAQENIKLLQWMSKVKFSVFTYSYVNTAINQSAFRIPKCYIII